MRWGNILIFLASRLPQFFILLMGSMTNEPPKSSQKPKVVIEYMKKKGIVKALRTQLSGLKWFLFDIDRDESHSTAGEACCASGWAFRGWLDVMVVEIRSALLLFECQASSDIFHLPISQHEWRCEMRDDKAAIKTQRPHRWIHFEAQTRRNIINAEMRAFFVCLKWSLTKKLSVIMHHALDDTLLKHETASGAIKLFRFLDGPTSLEVMNEWKPLFMALFMDWNAPVNLLHSAL